MEAVGWLAFALIQTFYIPQLLKLIRTKKVEGIAFPSWLILWLSLLLYLIYSIGVRDPVFIAGNSAGLIQTSITLLLILRYR